MNGGHVNLATLAVIISGLVLLIQLYRWLAGFASKTEVSKVEKDLQDKLATDSTNDAVAHTRIENTLVVHRNEARDGFEKLGGKLDSVLQVVTVNTAKIEDLRSWRETHVDEDREAHKVIEQVRDFMAVTADRDRRVDAVAVVNPRRGASKKLRGDLPRVRKKR